MSETRKYSNDIELIPPVWLDPADKFSHLSPREFGIPHDKWRDNQPKALNFVMENADSGPVIIELGTGSGKSSVATALGQNDPALVLVQSHALLDQYEREYGFDIVKGQHTYECVLPEKVESWKQSKNRVPTAAECHFEKMSDCPMYDRCPYIRAREKALASKRMACTYPFAILSNLVQKRPGYSIWDEAHMSADILLSLSEMRFTERWRQKFNLPSFPMRDFGEYLDTNGRKILIDWFNTCYKMTNGIPHGMPFEDEAEWKSTHKRIGFTMDTLANQSMEFFFECGDIEKESYFIRGREQTRYIPAMSIRPLSASMISRKLMDGKKGVVLMSATVGNPDPLASELGFDKFAFKSFPHPIPAKFRPVYDMGLARMTYENLKNMPMLYRIQAMQIREMIEEFPADWRGIILTSSYDKANRLREVLQETSLSSRLYSPPRGQEGLGDRINAFLEDKRKGLIVVDIAHGWGHGLNLTGDLARFAIVAGVPFGNQQDKFERVRKAIVKSSTNYAWWSSYTHVPQMCGRVSRGEIDKETGEPLLNVSALADGSATSSMAMKYYPEWFRESIVSWKGR